MTESRGEFLGKPMALTGASTAPSTSLMEICAEMPEKNVTVPPEFIQPVYRQGWTL